MAREPTRHSRPDASPLRGIAGAANSSAGTGEDKEEAQMVAENALPAAGQQKGFSERLLDGIEKAGNKVPHPVMMFLYLIILVIVLSQILALAGVSVTETIAEPSLIPTLPNYYEDTEYPVGYPLEGPYETDYTIREVSVPI